MAAAFQIGPPIIKIVASDSGNCWFLIFSSGFYRQWPMLKNQSHTFNATNVLVGQQNPDSMKRVFWPRSFTKNWTREQLNVDKKKKHSKFPCEIPETLPKTFFFFLSRCSCFGFRFFIFRLFRACYKATCVYLTMFVLPERHQYFFGEEKSRAILLSETLSRLTGV